jgi:4-carboxymuconolactone decarboxylase
MTLTDSVRPILSGALDAPTQELVRFAITIAVGREEEVRAAAARAVARGVNPLWVEELILQSYLFVGLPRALNAMREWRRASGVHAPAEDAGTDYAHAEEWMVRGQQTCAAVYGDTYERLRTNIRTLHPALEAWMIVEGYGKVLSRTGLDLARRELCIVAVCAATGQERQLHAHLRGATNVGATRGEVEDVLTLATERLDAESARRCHHLWTRVRGVQ